MRKLGAPGQPALGITRAQIERLVTREGAELARRRRLYRGDRAPIEVDGRTVVLIDDGIATGVTAVAAVRMLRERGATRTIVAVPVCPASAVGRLREQLGGELICLHCPHRFGGVGAWYDDFTQTSDAEVVALLRDDRPAG